MIACKEKIMIAATILIGSFAVALPLFISIFPVPIGAGSIGQFVSLHTHDGFGTRIWLTYIYFPAAITIHYLALPVQGGKRMFFLLGFAFFFAGNVVDLVYRAVQYEVVHLSWAAEYLRAPSDAVRQGYADKIAGFSELAPAISLSFALLFFIGRTVMGASLWLTSTRLGKCASAGLIVNGLWNILPHAGLTFGGLVGTSYIYVWILSLVLVTMLAATRICSNRYKIISTPAHSHGVEA